MNSFKLIGFAVGAVLLAQTSLLLAETSQAPVEPYEIGRITFFIDAEKTDHVWTAWPFYFPEGYGKGFGFDPYRDFLDSGQPNYGGAWANWGAVTQHGKRTLVAHIFYPVEKQDAMDAVKIPSPGLFPAPFDECMKDFLGHDTLTDWLNYASFDSPSPDGPVEGRVEFTREFLVDPADDPTEYYPNSNYDYDAWANFCNEGITDFSSTVLNAPLAKLDKFPVIIYDHGNTGSGDSFSIPTLIKNGYIVISLDHVGESVLSIIGKAGAEILGVPAEDPRVPRGCDLNLMSPLPEDPDLETGVLYIHQLGDGGDIQYAVLDPDGYRQVGTISNDDCDIPYSLTEEDLPTLKACLLSVTSNEGHTLPSREENFRYHSPSDPYGASQSGQYVTIKDFELDFFANQPVPPDLPDPWKIYFDVNPLADEVVYRLPDGTYYLIKSSDLNTVCGFSIADLPDPIVLPDPELRDCIVDIAYIKEQISSKRYFTTSDMQLALEAFPRALGGNTRSMIRLHDILALVDVVKQINKPGPSSKVLGVIKSDKTVVTNDDALDMFEGKLDLVDEQTNASNLLLTGLSRGGRMTHVLAADVSAEGVFKAAISDVSVYDWQPPNTGFTMPFMAFVGYEDEAFGPFSGMNSAPWLAYVYPWGDLRPWGFERLMMLYNNLNPWYLAGITNASHFGGIGDLNFKAFGFEGGQIYKESPNVDLSGGTGYIERYPMIDQKLVVDLRNLLFKTWFDLYGKDEICSNNVVFVRDINNNVIAKFPHDMHNLARLTDLQQLQATGVIVDAPNAFYGNLITPKIAALIGEGNDINNMHCNGQGRLVPNDPQ